MKGLKNQLKAHYFYAARTSDQRICKVNTYIYFNLIHLRRKTVQPCGNPMSDIIPQASLTDLAVVGGYSASALLNYADLRLI